MSRQTVQIGPYSFKSKKDATEFFCEIRDRNISGEPLRGEERIAVEALLSCHPRAGEKIGTGITALTVAPDGHGTFCFFAHRLDGELIDFSIPKCVRGDDPPFTCFSKACRSAISFWMSSWRQQQLEASEQRDMGLVRCVVTGEWLPLSAADADHVAPLTFARIVNDFAILQNIDVVAFDAYLRQGTENLRFEDKSLSDTFCDYHATVARLRIVKRIINQQGAYLGRLARQQKCA